RVSCPPSPAVRANRCRHDLPLRIALRARRGFGGGLAPDPAAPARREGRPAREGRLLPPRRILRLLVIHVVPPLGASVASACCQRRIASGMSSGAAPARPIAASTVA